jgi:hypothetical protein
MPLLCAAGLSEEYGQAADAAQGEQLMKDFLIGRADPEAAEVPVEELTPQPDPPAVRHPHKIVLAIAGKRYEFTFRTEVREITKGPAKLIEMPGRPAVNR